MLCRKFFAGDESESSDTRACLYTRSVGTALKKFSSSGVKILFARMNGFKIFDLTFSVVTLTRVELARGGKKVTRINLIEFLISSTIIQTRSTLSLDNRDGDIVILKISNF